MCSYLSYNNIFVLIFSAAYYYMDTPAKKRKIESMFTKFMFEIYIYYCIACCICPETWTTLVAELPPGMLDLGISDLPKILATKGSLSTFCDLDGDMQKYWLSKLLGDDSPLIDVIIELAKVSAVEVLIYVLVHELFIFDEGKTSNAK